MTTSTIEPLTLVPTCLQIKCPAFQKKSLLPINYTCLVKGVDCRSGINFILNINMSIEIKGTAREKRTVQFLAAAYIVKPTPLCYDIINEVKVQSNRSLDIKLNNLHHIQKLKSHLQPGYKAVYVLQCQNGRDLIYVMF